MAQNIRKTINNDLETIQGANSTFFTGIDDTINLNHDIFVTGYSFIFWIQLPSWFEKDPDLKYFKAMTEKNYQSFQGLTEMNLNTQSLPTGFTGREIETVTGITVGNTDFTLAHKEYSGMPMRKMYQKWVSYIRDPRTGIAIYPKLFGVDYGARNHTGQLMYIVVRPDATNTEKNIVEFAAFYSNVFPTAIPIGELNFERGTQDTPITTMPFKGFMEIGPDVEEYAKRILREKILKLSDGNDGLPFLDSYGTDTEVSSLINAGTLKDIYNYNEQ